jgi:hypothetical protein
MCDSKQAVAQRNRDPKSTEYTNVHVKEIKFTNTRNTFHNTPSYCLKLITKDDMRTTQFITATYLKVL